MLKNNTISTEAFEKIITHFSENHWRLNETIVIGILDQLIRSTLEAAAERARSWYIRTAGVDGCKSLEEAILEPLN
jgi:hypothetical protein